MLLFIKEMSHNEIFLYTIIYSIFLKANIKIYCIIDSTKRKLKNYSPKKLAFAKISCSNKLYTT